MPLPRHMADRLHPYEATPCAGGQETGSRGYYGVEGYWYDVHRQLAHITLLDLITVRLNLQDFAANGLLQVGEVV